MTGGGTTQYAKNGDVHLAYQVLGDGPFDLLQLAGDFIPTDAWDEQPQLARAVRRLASFSRLIRTDRRGVGLSDPITPATPPTLEQWMGDTLAVLDVVESDRCAVMATNDAGALAMLLAATHPDRVSALVLVNAYARALEEPDYPFGWPAHVAERMTQDTIDPSEDIGWGLEAMAPSMAGDEGFRRWFDRAGNRGASPATAKALLNVYMGSDVRSILGSIVVPTLVLHRTDDVAITAEHGRYLAQHIPGATLVELPGPDDLYWTGDADGLLDEVEGFLTGTRRRAELDSMLATVLFTDIVGSTGKAIELGDLRWRELLDRHDEVCRHRVEHWRGRVVKSTGDGVLATFDGPARAVACALELGTALRQIGLPIRTGMHTGEVQLRGDDIGGIAVHIAARIQALAEPDQVLVSRTIPDLVVGSGIAFRDCGVHRLKGIESEWQLYSVEA